MAIVVDDHVLVDLLADTATGWLRSEIEHSAIYTTAAWYYRVANAAHRGSGDGACRGASLSFPRSSGGNGSMSSQIGSA